MALKVFITLLLVSKGLLAQNDNSLIIKYQDDNFDTLSYDEFYTDRLRFGEPLFKVRKDKKESFSIPSKQLKYVFTNTDTFAFYKGKVQIHKIDGSIGCFTTYMRADDLYIPYGGVITDNNYYYSINESKIKKLNQKAINEIVAGYSLDQKEGEKVNTKNIGQLYNKMYCNH